MRANEFAELRSFEAVARHRSFARAAEELAVSRSALSQTIKLLEAKMAVRLLNRTTRSVAPTEAGAMLLTRLSPLLGQLDKLVREVSARNDGVFGTLRINAPRMAVMHVLAPIVAPFLKAYPHVTMDIVADDRLVDIVGDGFDAGIRLGETLAQDMIALKLGPELRMLVVAGPDYLARHGCPLTPRDLRSHRCINLRRQTSGSIYRWEFEKDTEKLEVLLDGPLLVDEPTVAARAMRDGLGIAYLFEHDVADDLALGAAVPLLQDWTPPFPGLHLYYPNRDVAPPLRALIDFILKAQN